MKNVYAGSVEDSFYDQQMQQFSDEYENVWNGAEYESAVIELPADDVAHDIIVGIGDAIGYWPLLGLAGFGAVYFFRKRLSKLLKDYLK